MLFRAEDTSRANYRSLFEYAVGDEARLAQDRRLAYYEQVLPEMLARVKGLPLMYQTYSKQWTPESSRKQFVVKRLVPDFSKPIYEEDEDGNQVLKGYEKQDLVMESDQDIADFMARKGRFKGQHGFNKGFSYLAPIYHVQRDEMPFIQVDLDIDQADFGKQAWSRLLGAVEQVYNWFRENGYDALINFTGSSFHVWAKDGQVRTYAETKQVLEALSEATGLPLAAGAAHVAGQITIDYPQNKYRAPLRFPLSIHGDTGLVSIIIPRNQLRRFDPLTKAHPEQVLKQLPNHLAKIDAWFSDLPTTSTKKSAESQLSAADIIQRRLDELSDADKERCIWGDCGILADQLMKALQQAGHTDAVYEIGLAYIHPFEDYESKDFIGGHVVVTVDGESYDAYGAGAKERWVEGPVIQDILAESGFVELGPLLSAHLTVNWTTSTWDDIRESRSNLFSGQDVSAALDNWTLGKEAESSQTWYSSGNVHPWQLFLETETLGPNLMGERDNYSYEDMKALESKYGLKPTSAVIWVSAMPEVAASYMIGQGLLDNSDEEVKEDYGFSKSDLETTEFGQIYYPPHVDLVNQYQGTIILETDDGDGGYLLSLNRDYTGRYGLKRIGMAAETEYKKKRQKPTPEPGVEGGTDLKPARRKPPMKVKGSDVYSVQKHRADKRGSHRDIRIGLDGTLLSFVPVGRGFGKSRLPKKIGEGISVIRTEDHPFDYWWFEGEIPKDSYGAGPVSLETHGTRRIIEWKPDEKLKVEFIGGKYAGTYTFERSKKSKDGKVWWMRKSRPVPEGNTDKKTKKAEEKWYGPPALEAVINEDVRDQYGYSMFSKALAEWSEKFLAEEGNAKDMIERAYYDDGAGPGDGFIVDYDPSNGMVDILLDWVGEIDRLPASEAVERFARRYVEELLISAKYHRGRIKLYRGIQLVNPEDFDPTEVGQSWTPLKTAAKPYFGFQKYYSRNLERIYSRTADSETYVLTALVPVESINWYYTLMRALSFGASDEKEIVLKRGAPIELVDVPFDLSFAIDGTPEALIRAAEEDDEDWWFTMNTPLGPNEEFGPYDSYEDAMSGIERVMQKIVSLQDGYTREFPQPYQGRRGLGFGLRADTGKKSKTYFDDYDLYSDANPNDTIRIKYDTIENTRKTITKLESLRKKKTYSHARIVQVANVMVQRLRVIYDNTGRGKTRYDLAKQYFEKLKRITAKKKTKKSEQDDGGKSEFKRKYLVKVREYEQSEEWYNAVREMENMGDETFYYELEGRLESLFPDLELPLSQKDYEELTLTNPELITEERSIARSISDDMLDRVYAMLFARQGTYWNYMVSWSKEHEAEYRDGKILLYREITMNNPAELDTARAGIFWTPVLQAAEAHWGGTGEHFLLRALVDFEDINWNSSWYANLIHPEECEIRLRQGAKIELLPLTRPPSRYGRNRQVGEYVYPEEIVFEIEAPSPNLLAVEQGTETELLEAIKDLPEEYQRLIGIYPVEPQPTRTGFASEQDEVVLYHGTATANVESILQEGLRPDYGWAMDSFQKGVFLATHPSSAAPWARWSAMRALAPDSQIASEGETSKFYQLMARLRMEEADAVTILEVRIPKNSYQDLYCDYADLLDSGIELTYAREARSNEDYDWTFEDDEELVKSWEECLRNGINLVYEGGRIPPEWISVLPWQSEWKSNYWFERITDMISERGEDYFDAEDIDLTVGEAFDTALAEIRADVEAIQPRSKDISEVTLEDYEKTKQVYQRFMIPAGITGSIIRDEWWYESEPIYLWSDMFTLPAGAEEEWQQKIDAQKTGTESDIFASDEINYAFYWFAVLQINSIYNWLLSRLGERKMYTGVYTGPPVELPDIIESQRDETEVKIYRWLATSQDEQPVRRLRNRLRPVDLNYYGGYGPNIWTESHEPVDSPGNRNVAARKGLQALSYGPCWSLSPDAYTRTDQWRLAQEDVVFKEREVTLSPFEKAWRMPTEEEIDVRTYVIEKSIPASALDWYSTLISSALWLDSPEYEVIPKRGVFLSEEVDA